MTPKQAILFFEEHEVRTVWDDDAEKWYISIVDTVCALTECPTPAAYWNTLKQRFIANGNELVAFCRQLQMQAADGELYDMDVADSEQLFRLLQTIPSPKAETFKFWLEDLCRKRPEEMKDLKEVIVTRRMAIKILASMIAEMYAEDKKTC